MLNGIEIGQDLVGMKFGHLLVIERIDKPTERIGQLPAPAIDFHHKNPNEKSFPIGAWGHYAKGPPSHQRDLLVSEIEKCLTLCAICHRLVEFHELNVSRIATIKLDEKAVAQFNSRNDLKVSSL